jgi:hypothetical protein
VSEDAIIGEPLVDFETWFNTVFRKPNGQPYGRRSRNKFAKKVGLPVVKVGWARLVNPRAANAKLERYHTGQSEEPARRGRGRPRARERR